jgi:drug/metabolite transporter (DMT)-like permease
MIASPPPPRPWRYDAGLALVVLIWGLNFAVIKVALEEAPPFTVNALRFIVSILVIGGLYFRQRQDEIGGFFGPLKRAPWRIVGLGMLGYVGYQVCFIVGVNLTSAGSAALIVASAPLWTALLAQVVGVDHLPRAAWVALAVSLVGVAVVTLSGGPAADGESRTILGDLLMLGSAAMWAAYTVASRPVFAAGGSPTGVTFWGVAAALPILLGLGLYESPHVHYPGLSITFWLAILFSGGLSTGLAYAIWNVVVKAIGPSQTAASTNVVPFVAVLAGVLILGESISTGQIIGGVLIIGSIVLMRRVRGRVEPRAAARG